MCKAMALIGSLQTAQVQRLGCSCLLFLFLCFSCFYTGSSIGVGHKVASDTLAAPPLAIAVSLGTEQMEELCFVGTLPAIKFLAVAGMGFMAGGALTIQAPLASALLHAL